MTGRYGLEISVDSQSSLSFLIQAKEKTFLSAVLGKEPPFSVLVYLRCPSRLIDREVERGGYIEG